MASPVFRVALFATLLTAAFAAKFVEDASGFNYDRNGDDWEGLCQTGEEQSPININTADDVELDEPELKVDVDDVGEIEGMSIFSTGAALEVIWKKFSRKPSIKVAAKDGDIFTIFSKSGSKVMEGVEKLDAEPIQFHFHSPSENAINGRLAPLCVHIVCKISEGQSEICDKETCLVVLGVHFEYDDPTVDNKMITKLFKKLPTEVGKENGKKIKGKFDLNTLIPKNREHFTWKGSLTTPPCTEGVLWVMYSSPLLVSTAQVNAHQQAAAFSIGPDCEDVVDGVCDPPRQSGNHRPIQALNGRVIRKSET
ncbi:hypothetical protein BSKO_13663 [Bryopsis sp. KO-2023]|nr:hypothetical protein BSKO_13663 [Bryopsis sp. KO-2023]